MAAARRAGSVSRPARRPAVRAAADGAEVLHNGVRVQRSTWLRSGDVVNLGAARLRIADNDTTASAWSRSTTAAAATSPRRRSFLRARGCRDRATAMRSASKRFAFALRRSPSRRRRISLSPIRVVLAAVAVVTAVVLWFIFTATSVSLLTVRLRRTCEFPAGCPRCVSEIACCCDQAITTCVPSWRAMCPRRCRSRSRRRRTRPSR